MLSENVVKIDFEKMDKAIKESEPPIVITMSVETMYAISGQAESNPNITVEESEFDQMVLYRNIPIIPNTYAEFGHVLIK